MTSTLSRQVGAAVDAAVAATPGVARFAKVKARDGMSFRSYYSQSDGVEAEICLYKDKWWTQDGGRVNAELFCLVEEVQLALAGVAQSWRAPDHARPLRHFQFGLSEDGSAGWAIASAADVVTFERELRAWLAEVAAPWFEQFATREGVIRHLEHRRQFANLALFFHHVGRPAQARDALVAFLETLPRQIGRILDDMTRAGLLAVADRNALDAASMQREDDYRELVRTWIDRGVPA